MTQSPDQFDHALRRFVYAVALRRGSPPTIAETVAGLQTTSEDVLASFQRLATGRVLVLQTGSHEILMANPFSAVPTPFLVEFHDYACYGNCIWDALGILAMRGAAGRVRTSCGDCAQALELRVADGSLQAGEGVIHFALPARHWWDDIVFT